MAQYACNKCDKMVDDVAETCPFCGAKNIYLTSLQNTEQGDENSADPTPLAQPVLCRPYKNDDAVVVQGQSKRSNGRTVHEALVNLRSKTNYPNSRNIIRATTVVNIIALIILVGIGIYCMFNSVDLENRGLNGMTTGSILIIIGVLGVPFVFAASEMSHMVIDFMDCYLAKNLNTKN